MYVCVIREKMHVVVKFLCLAQSGEIQPCVKEALGILMKVFENHSLLIIALLTSLSCVTVVLDTKT